MNPDCQLFLGDPKNRTVSTFNSFLIPIATTLTGLASSFARNLVTGRPVRNGNGSVFFFE